MERRKFAETHIANPGPPEDKSYLLYKRDHTGSLRFTSDSTEKDILRVRIVRKPKIYLPTSHISPK